MSHLLRGRVRFLVDAMGGLTGRPDLFGSIVYWNWASDSSKMNVALGECDFNPGFLEFLIDRCMQVVDCLQAFFKRFEIAAENDIQSTLSKLFETREGRRIVHDSRMFFGDLNEQFPG